MAHRRGAYKVALGKSATDFVETADTNIAEVRIGS